MNTLLWIAGAVVIGTILIVVILVVLLRQVLSRGLFSAGEVKDGPTIPSARIDQNVQFTVYRPAAIVPNKQYTLLAFAHLSKRRADAPPDEPDPVKEVQRLATKILSDRRRNTNPPGSIAVSQFRARDFSCLCRRSKAAPSIHQRKVFSG